MRRIVRPVFSIVSACFAVAGFALLFLPFTRAQQPPQRLQVRGVALAHAGRAGYGSEACRRQLGAIKELGGNWISLTDFAFMSAIDRPGLSFGRSMEAPGMARAIKDAHEAGLKVLVKPHIWSRDFGGGKKWAADIHMTSDADWQAWFEEYRQYILMEAKLAAESGADALSVGCELEGTSQAQEARWRSLIADVRKIYSGYVIYSAAFAEWQKVPWWDAVDCIGVNAYLPLTQTENATDEELRGAWKRIYDQELTPFQKKWNKPICFTEIGYTASSKAAAEPWAYGVTNPSVVYQARLYKIALEEAAKRDYVRGVFLWKWFSGDVSQSFDRGDPFIIQNRAEVLKAIRGSW